MNKTQAEEATAANHRLGVLFDMNDASKQRSGLVHEHLCKTCRSGWTHDARCLIKQVYVTLTCPRCDAKGWA